jgi:hypothetical protein
MHPDNTRFRYQGSPIWSGGRFERDLSPILLAYSAKQGVAPILQYFAA